MPKLPQNHNQNCKHTVSGQRALSDTMASVRTVATGGLGVTTIIFPARFWAWNMFSIDKHILRWNILN